jgi:hypothetical protein
VEKAEREEKEEKAVKEGKVVVKEANRKEEVKDGMTTITMIT